MPTYDYVCRKCEHRFEQFQSMTEAPLVKCPQCGREALERLIGAGAGILFKGSGFYETDYKRPASKSPDAKSGDSKGGEAPKTGSPAPPAKADKPAAGGSATDKGASAKPAAPSKGTGPSKGPAKSD